VELAGAPEAVVDDVRRWLAADAADDAADGVGDDVVDPVVVETSGSSGRPKRVVLSRAAVLASVEASARRLGGHGSGPWVLLLPPTFVAGLQVVCRSLVAGHPPLHALPPAGAAADLGDWSVSLVPTQLHRALADPGQTAALREARTVLLGGGPVDPALRARARDEGVTVVATYGSAETAGGCVYDGVPLDGVGLDLAADGRVRLGGPTLFDRYDGDPALTAEVLVDGWFTTADVGRLGEDGRLQVLGRVDDVVLSGGVNVPAPAVAARLREHPDVAAAEALGVPDPEWGQQLVAFVAWSAGVRPVPTADLRDWVASAHPRAWAPRRVLVVDDIPLLANGKPDRLALRRLASAS